MHIFEYTMHFMEKMTTKHCAKLVHERECVAEADVELIYSDDGWAPYLSMEDTYKLDDVREALRLGDVKAASRLAKADPALCLT